MIRGEHVCLRPVEQADLPTMAGWTNDVDVNSEYNFFGLEPTHNLEQSFMESGFLSDRHGSLMIVTPSGEVVGSMSYRQVAYGPNSGSQAYAIGLSLLPEWRGRGYGTEAQRLLAEYLFQIYPIARVEASTDSTNLREQRSLEKAGFTREGVLRKAQWRTGEWHDLVQYSKLRGE